jgi:hypothetical protein
VADVLGLGFLLHIVHVACRLLDIIFLMTRCSHWFTKRMTSFSHSCPTLVLVTYPLSDLGYFPLFTTLVSFDSHLYVFLSTITSYKFTRHRRDQPHS